MGYNIKIMIGSKCKDLQGNKTCSKSFHPNVYDVINCIIKLLNHINLQKLVLLHTKYTVL